MNPNLTSILEELHQLNQNNQLEPAVWEFVERRVLSSHSVPSSSAPGFDVFATAANPVAATSNPPVSSTVLLPSGVPAGGAPSLDSAGPLTPGDVVASRYHVLHCLGVGGMGAVYLVQDVERRRPVAMKCLHSHDDMEELEEHLRRELRLNETLTHANIVRTYSLVRDRQRRLLCMTMEFVPGDTLATLMTSQTQGTSLAEPIRLLSWLRNIAEGLAWAHRHNIVHCDLKPANVMVVGDSAKVMDFGISSEATSWNRSKAGSPYYMAPEQLRGGQVSPSTDMYSLGILAFQLLTGYVPQPGMPGPSSLNDALPSSVDDLFLQAMHWVPEERATSTVEWVLQLEQSLGSASAESSGRYRSKRRSPTAPQPEAVPEISRPAPAQSATSPRLVWSRVKPRIDRKRPEWLVEGERPPPSWYDREDWLACRDTGQLLIPKHTLCEGSQKSRLLLSRQGHALLELVWIPAGEAWVGAASDADGVSPHETPHVSTDVEGFWMSRTPVTNRVWSIFLEESNYQPSHKQTRSYYLRHWGNSDSTVDASLWHKPVVWLSWLDVWAFCDFYGVSLPTEVQWEKAMRGDDGRSYPWGEEPPTAARCNCQGWAGGVVEVGSFPEGGSPYLLLGGVGNVFEWCAERWDPKPWTTRLHQPFQPPKHERDRVVVRGGHYNAPVSLMRASYRQAAALLQGNAHTGFRPVVDAPK
ncbi:MAG: hypothetical protein EP343_27600 [Deltaproteobacteria bacterium]|nr:MAG: hypothetical protein EP343_27600 [Deltaproteobacteria bacterium]